MEPKRDYFPSGQQHRKGDGETANRTENMEYIFAVRQTSQLSANIAVCVEWRFAPYEITQSSAKFAVIQISGDIAKGILEIIAQQ
jgi:hypothetical protein